MVAVNMDCQWLWSQNQKLVMVTIPQMLTIDRHMFFCNPRVSPRVTMFPIFNRLRIHEFYQIW